MWLTAINSNLRQGAVECHEGSSDQTVSTPESGHAAGGGQPSSVQPGPPCVDINDRKIIASSLSDPSALRINSSTERRCPRVRSCRRHLVQGSARALRHPRRRAGLTSCSVTTCCRRTACRHSSVGQARRNVSIDKTSCYSIASANAGQWRICKWTRVCWHPQLTIWKRSDSGCFAQSCSAPRIAAARSGLALQAS
jgi:hypothetical protein